MSNSSKPFISQPNISQPNISHERADQSPLPSLTKKEFSVLRFIEHQLSETGITPSYQEICDHFGYSSFNSVQNFVRQLVKKGYISVEPHQKRSLKVLHCADSLKKTRDLNDGAEDSMFLMGLVNLPLLGRVAAGSPLESKLHDEFFQIPESWISRPSRRKFNPYNVNKAYQKEYTQNPNQKSGLEISSFDEVVFALEVEGESMIDEGICEGDVLIVKKQGAFFQIPNGELVVARREEETTVKRFFLTAAGQNPLTSNKMNENSKFKTYSNRGSSAPSSQLVELRPSNKNMSSLWYRLDEIQIEGIVIGLVRKYR